LFVVSVAGLRARRATVSGSSPDLPKTDGFVVAVWTPAESLAVGPSGLLSPEIVCSALDCPAIRALVAVTDPEFGRRRGDRAP